MQFPRKDVLYCNENHKVKHADCPICSYDLRASKNDNEPRTLTIYNRDGTTTEVTPPKPWGSF